MIFFFAVTALLIPVTAVIIGLIFTKHPPGKINGIYGYRTARSMKNKDTWKFAHLYSGKIYLIVGIALLIVSEAPIFLGAGLNTDALASVLLAVVAAQLAFIIFPIFPTEAALKRTFDDSGQMKKPPKDGD